MAAHNPPVPPLSTSSRRRTATATQPTPTASRNGGRGRAVGEGSTPPPTPPDPLGTPSTHQQGELGSTGASREVWSGAALALRAMVEQIGAHLAEPEATLLRRSAENVAALLSLLSGVEPLRPASLDLGDVMMGVLPGWTRSTPRHTFELALPGSLPTVIADATLAEQTFNALLAAAVRMAPSGAVIRARVRAAPDAVEVVISTEAADLPSRTLLTGGNADLFAPDLDAATGVNLDAPARHPSAPNAALDLTLARAAVERLGGKTRSEVRAQPGGAARVELVTTWPLVPPPAPIQLPNAHEADAASRQQAQLFALRRERVVLLVAADVRMGRFLRGHLEAQGYAVAVASSVDEACHQADLLAPDLALVDGGAVGTTGGPIGADPLPALLAALACPTIVLAGQSDPLACARALDQGAADWVPRPFSTEELLARVRAVLRRQPPAPEPPEPVFACGALSIDFAQRLVTLAGEPVGLSKTEYKLLRTLAQHPGRVVGHEALLERVWGPGYADAVEFLWVYVRRLRRKIEPDPAHPRYIQTVPGVGYRLAHS